eukprot:8904726-Pyramimonas_sp.AAC.1
MISQFFVLSVRGDVIISRDYRYDVPKTSSETFFRKVKFWGREGETAPPVFHADGVNYFHLKCEAYRAVPHDLAGLCRMQDGRISKAWDPYHVYAARFLAYTSDIWTPDPPPALPSADQGKP